MRNKDNRPKKRKPTKSQEVIFMGNVVNRVKYSKNVWREIRRLQGTTDLLIPKLPFSRVVREILQQLNRDMKMQYACLQALQEAAEHYLVDLFENVQRCSFHAKRQTIKPSDIQLVLDVRGIRDPGYKGFY